MEDDKTWSLEKLSLNNPLPSKSTNSVVIGPESFEMILLTSELYYRFCDKVMLLEPEFPARGWHIALCSTMDEEIIWDGFEIRQMQISAIFYVNQVSDLKKCVWFLAIRNEWFFRNELVGILLPLRIKWQNNLGGDTQWATDYNHAMIFSIRKAVVISCMNGTPCQFCWWLVNGSHTHTEKHIKWIALWKTEVAASTELPSVNYYL